MHAVRARPLLIIKKNIEPDEQREEADTIPTRGVNPESLPAPGSRPALYTSVGLVVNANAPTPRARGCFFHMQGLLCHGVGLSPKTERPCLCYFAPMRGLSNSGGIRPRVRYFFAPGGAQKFGSLTLADSHIQLPICGGPGVFRDAQIVIRKSTCPKSLGHVCNLPKIRKKVLQFCNGWSTIPTAYGTASIR